MSQLHPNAIPFSDDVIRAFLLGRLDVAEQKQFEEKLIADDDLETRVRMAELLLADDFVFERINRVDSRQFEKNFLLTTARKRQLMVSTALRDRFASARETETRHSWRLHQFFTFNRPAMRFAFAVAIALLLIASFYLVTKEPQIVKRILPKRAPSKPAVVSTPQEVHHPRDLAPPEHRDTPTPPPDHESTLHNSAQIVATVSLSPGNPGDVGEAGTINLPSDPNGVVRLHLAVEQNSSEGFKAELLTDSNQSLFVMESLRKTDSSGIDFDVPVRVLKTGRYQVQLSRLHNGSTQVVANYYFGIR
jgi:hypothetical protein